MAESSTITREGALMTKVPDDHPLMIAWKAYTATGDYENTKGWCVGPHAEGSLWAAFERGFMAASVMPHPTPPGGPVANPEGERIYSAIAAQSRAEIPEEERGASSMVDAVRFIGRWMPESLPASDTGQIPFGRALLEMAVDAMKAAISPSPADLGRLDIVCSRAIAAANITNCHRDEVRPVVLAILADLATGGADV
ncbi:hypothetical protein ACLBYG_22095 [Methylobacterium sp. D53M]